jgi:signal transduction histidine kinase
MDESNNIMQTSAEILKFNVEDILGLASIKAGKFLKNEEYINIEKTVQEIVKIQEYSA